MGTTYFQARFKLGLTLGLCSGSNSTSESSPSSMSDILEAAEEENNTASIKSKSSVSVQTKICSGSHDFSNEIKNFPYLL